MLLVRGGRVVGAQGVRDADVLVDGERILAVGPGLDPAGAEVLEAGGALVIPGGVDVHTHLDLPVGGVRSADDFESGTLAAACGGTTCVIDFAGAGREDPDAALREWHAKADGAAIDHGFHLTITSVPEDPAEAAARFRSFVEAGVTSVKLYLAYPDRLMVDDATLARALVAAKTAGVLVCVHAEDGPAAQRGTEDTLAAGERGPAGLALARPAEIEADAIRTVGALARAAGASAYIVHLSSAAGLEALLEARRAGADLLAETCPHYLFLTADRLQVEREDAQDHCCTPPLRADADREALWDALARGELEAIATDHCPFTRADRRAGIHAREEGWRDFTEIPGGLPGIETRVALAYQGVLDGRYDEARWVGLVATTPATLFGLGERKGRLEAGMDADVVVFDPGATKRLDAAELHSRSDHSPYAGMTVRGWPAITISRGRVVARDGEPVDGARGWGRYVRRARSTR